jgi:hypothetical protein
MKPIGRLLVGAVLAAATIGAGGSSVSAVDRELVERWRERPVGAGERQPSRFDGDDRRARWEAREWWERRAPWNGRARWEDRLPPLRPPLASPH